MGGDAVDVTVDGPDGPRTVRVSNPDRRYFPELGATKADVVRYFLSVVDGLARALHDRPTMLERWPTGVVPGAKLTVWRGEPGDAFYQRRLPKGAPDWVQGIRVAGANGTSDEMICPTEPAVAIWAANLGTLRFHTWPARRSDVWRPDELRVDLDPQPGTAFPEAVRVALELRDVLGELGMEGFAKTSGGRGVHVYVPIAPLWPLDDVRRGVLALGRELARRLPHLVTVERWKRERGERVYVDHNQMAGTIASAYSIRPTPRALVSAPVTWDELTEAAPEDFDITTMPARFAAIGDLHAELDGPRHVLDPLLELADRQERHGAGGEPPPTRRGEG